MGKSTISMVMFHSYVKVYQRVTTISVADKSSKFNESTAHLEGAVLTDFQFLGTVI
jgi:hypothetical protein